MDKFLIVKKAIDRADYYNLLQHGAPNDEYDTESEKISERISDTDSVEKIAEIISEVFSRSFSWKITSEEVKGAAKEIRCGLMGCG